MKRFRVDISDVKEEFEAENELIAEKMVKDNIAIIEVDEEGCDL